MGLKSFSGDFPLLKDVSIAKKYFNEEELKILNNIVSGYFDFAEILDEEQRFGVRHKEKLKALKKNVDVLTLTATPIPRTLQLSLSGIRELSIIETAPQDRKPVASAVLGRDDATLRKVLARELEREGQVFWVYNRVQDMQACRGS